MAQNQNITISTSVTHSDATPLYKALITVGSGYSSLPSEVMTIESLKERYKNALEEAGFTWQALKENPNGFGYETLSNKENGIIYQYTTTVLEDMRKFMKIRPLGVESLHVISVIEIDEEEHLKLVQLAINDARLKAKAITNAMGATLGHIIKVEDITNRWGNTIETSVYYDRPPNECKYTIDVTFKIEDQ
ncbi:hypothetical protein MHTCC0001_13320 [Flavobacteriaceae bacterium MHTCC 0001]